jgi:hypothetical protein
MRRRSYTTTTTTRSGARRRGWAGRNGRPATTIDGGPNQRGPIQRERRQSRSTTTTKAPSRVDDEPPGTPPFHEAALEAPLAPLGPPGPPRWPSRPGPGTEA